MIDDLVPLPVVVERLHDQRDQDDAPEAEAEVGKADIMTCDPKEKNIPR